MQGTPLSRRVRNHWQLYLLLLIPLSYIIVFCYLPMAGVQIAFRNYNFRLGIWGSEWVGTKYFARFFASYQFTRVLGNTVTLSLYSLIAGFPLPIIFALLLNVIGKKGFRKTVETVTYLPHFISTVVLVGILNQVFNTRVGLIATLWKALDLGAPGDVWGSAAAFKHLYVWSAVWQNLGWNTIIYTAALSATDPEQHEAMQIDGASRFQRLLHLDFPTILPTATMLLILGSGGIMNIGFEKALLMQNNLNISASEVISTYVYKVGLSGSATASYSYATAIGLFNSLVNFLVLVIVNHAARRMSDSSIW